MAEPTENKVDSKPWDMDWLEKPKQAVMQAVESVKSAVAGVKMPWEMDWKEKPRVTPSDSQKAPTEPSGGFNMNAFMDKVIKAESSGKADAKSKTSTALGLAQFTNTTWVEQVAKQGKNYTLKDRTDPAKVREILAGFTKDNYERAKKQLGRDPSEAELYAYHMLPYGASKLIKAEDDVAAASLYSKAITKANKEIFYKEENKKLVPRSVGEVKKIFERKVK